MGFTSPHPASNLLAFICSPCGLMSTLGDGTVSQQIILPPGLPPAPPFLPTCLHPLLPCHVSHPPIYKRIAERLTKLVPFVIFYLPTLPQNTKLSNYIKLLELSRANHDLLVLLCTCFSQCLKDSYYTSVSIAKSPVLGSVPQLCIPFRCQFILCTTEIYQTED